jgi:cytochrome c1
METISLIEMILLFIGSILIYTLAKTVWQEITNK